MSDFDPESCSRCGFPVEKDLKCANCGVLLCPWDIRVYEGKEVLCQRCYEDLTFQYHSKECDILKK